MLVFAFMAAAVAVAALGVVVLTGALLLIAPPAGIAVSFLLVVAVLYLVASVVAGAAAVTWVGLTRAAYAAGAVGRRAREAWTRPVRTPAHLSAAGLRPFHWHVPHWHVPHHSH